MLSGRLALCSGSRRATWLLASPARRSRPPSSCQASMQSVADTPAVLAVHARSAESLAAFRKVADDDSNTQQVCSQCAGLDSPLPTAAPHMQRSLRNCA